MFATSWNGVSMMREGTKEHDRKVEIWRDASGSWGCGGLWGARWFQVAWSAWPDFAEASIAAKELYCQSLWRWQSGAHGGGGMLLCVIVTINLWWMM